MASLYARFLAERLTHISRTSQLVRITHRIFEKEKRWSIIAANG